MHTEAEGRVWLWVSSQQLISPPRLRMLRLLPDLINLEVDLSRCKGSVAEIAQSPLTDLPFNRLSIIVYPPHHLSRFCETSEGDFDFCHCMSHIFPHDTAIALPPWKPKKGLRICPRTGAIMMKYQRIPPIPIL